jgi:hypothetical protein
MITEEEKMGKGHRGESYKKTLFLAQLRYNEVLRRGKFYEDMFEAFRLVSQLSDLLNVLIELRPEYPRIFSENMEQRNMVANLTHLLRRIAVILDEETKPSSEE